MSNWTICGSCGLGHTPREGGMCPRCNNSTSAMSSSAAAGPSFVPQVSQQDYAALEEGSSTLGFCLGMFLGLWGLIGALIFGKTATKRGAGYGFLARLGLTAVVVAIALMSG